MELSIIRVSLCLVIFLSPLGCECGIQRNPLNDKLEKDILDLHGYIVGIRTEIYQERRNRDEILLRMNETIFRCYGKCGTNENKQEYDLDSLTTIKTSIHSLQRGLREEKRMNAIMKSKIEDLQEENNKLKQALKIMNEEKIEHMNLMSETLKQINENVNKALQGAMEDKNKMMEVISDIQNLKQENKDLNLAAKVLNEKQKAESYAKLDIMSRIETIKDENQNLDKALAEIKEVISFNNGPVMKNGKPWQQYETLNQEKTGGDKVPDVIKKNTTVPCATLNISNVIFHPVKKSYEANETVSLTGCLYGLDLVGAKSLSCRKDGSWYGDAKCISYECVTPKDLNKISLYNGDIPYYDEIVPNGKVLSIKCKCPGITAVPDQVTCMGGKWNHPADALFEENSINKPEAFITRGSPEEKVNDRACIDICVVPMDLNSVYIYDVDSAYSFKIAQDGMVLPIKCKVPGLTAFPNQITCMGGKWSHLTERISCIR